MAKSEEAVQMEEVARGENFVQAGVGVKVM
jgi:hypothetical protein